MELQVIIALCYFGIIPACFQYNAVCLYRGNRQWKRKENGLLDSKDVCQTDLQPRLKSQAIKN